jgi:diadenosine tetraphosphatase ApaH/serine/threonine PP2A family protein phosphatase
MRTVRVAVISDIHANLHALDAVLVDVDRLGPDRLWCLGDVVGYGPRPNECTARVSLRADLCLVGNHDLVVLGTRGVGIEAFNADAAAAARWTSEQLADDARAFLEGLEPRALQDGVALFHASARDPVWEYVLDGESALATIELAPAPLVIVGHSHVALELALADGALSGGVAPAGRTVELGGARRLLNPGSVGQPRDGDPRAAWLLLDLGAGRAEFRRVEYDVERTQSEMAAAGLPPALAARLAAGL